ncbi:hypothetical protein KI659_18105 [Litoribacter alkaliphilus]|uniref:Uncharacterized protein n=1 Tax=Litoribacter ruber TaxID=702568 RepID=A0AAP2CL44_9BACT|nr:DUF6642 family protein [Litoribacter alkaliphilus]MBS9525940.1 hypothetical protein [Litoribacter alkaliphilus]
MDYNQYIFSLEGEWEGTLKSKNTIEPTLEFLQHAYKIKFIHRRVALKEDLIYYLDQAVKAKYSNYNLIHLAFHGSSKEIWMADNKSSVGLEELAERYEGRFKGRTVHFGSCKTLKASPAELEYFLKMTEAELVSGYTVDVDFIDSAIFEIAYFTWMQEYKQKWRVPIKLKDEYPLLFERLGFVALSKKSSDIIMTE